MIYFTVIFTDDPLPRCLDYVTYLMA